MKFINEIKKMEEIDLRSIDTKDDIDLLNYDLNRQMLEKEVKTNFKNSKHIEKISDDLTRLQNSYDDISKLSRHFIDVNHNLSDAVMILIHIYDYIDDMLQALLNNGNLEVDSDKAICKCLKLIIEHTEIEMKKVGLIVENPIHKKYDTSLHEILDTVSDNRMINEMIIKVIKKGFIYKDKILRKAKVITVLNKEG